MGDLYQLAEGESRAFKLVPSKILPGDTATVRSSHPESVLVQVDQAPIVPGALVTGRVVGGKVPMSAVAIQGTVRHADDSTTTAVYLIDVGGGTPPAPKPAPPPEPIRVHLTIEPSAASKVKAAPKPEEKP